MNIPLQFAPLYDGQEVFVWPDYLLDLGTDFLVGQNHLARQSERGRKTRKTEKEMGREHQGMDRLGVRQVFKGSGEQAKVEETDCEIISCAPNDPRVLSKTAC